MFTLLTRLVENMVGEFCQLVVAQIPQELEEFTTEHAVIWVPIRSSVEQLIRVRIKELPMCCGCDNVLPEIVDIV